MSNSVEQRQTATIAYENAGREITQAFETRNANLTLAAGALGVLLTVLGAGQLFGNDIIIQVGRRVSKIPSHTFPKLVAGGFIVLALLWEATR
jgi:hypothetical protein